MSSREVKEYLSHHHLPQLLESLLTGVLYHRPDDPVSFLQSCLITTTKLGGPEAVTWDTFILLERHQLSPRPPSSTPGPPITSPEPPSSTPGPPTLSLPPIKPQTPQTSPPKFFTTPQITPPIAPITPSTPPKTTSVPPVDPQLTPPVPQIAQIIPQTTALIPQNSTPQIIPLIVSIKHKTPAEPKVLVSAAPGPAGTPSPVHSEKKEHGLSSEAPPSGPPPSPVRAQLSIDSDSDMTESSGLQQEVSILPPQTPHPLIIFIIGGPGSGKGSQAARLARCFSLRIISLDELLRRQLLSHASPSRKWSVISEMMGHGELGPQEETISELRRQLIGQQEVRGFIVDGFPRDVHQALSFQEQVGSPDLVMLLLCSNETLRCRLQRRATQLGLLGDNSHALRRRLEMFQRDIVSISRYYRQLHLQTQVDADRDEETVFADLSSVIRKKLLLKDSGPADIPECSIAVRSIDQ
ncbi:adenylate kinase isoenzyme 5-like [Pagrus major]|uniref:adenylate kinase isoenzyme 5-like n=1 Tax=Pagrus major TaxID=143350 RepID=UPI003CC869AA